MKGDTACFFGRCALLLNMDIRELVRQVKRNCDISDAQSWGNYSICGLLMRLRDLYLQEHGLMPWETIAEQDVTAWIQRREQTWREMESAAPAPLADGETSFDPFDADGLNRRLEQEGFVYGSGFGIMGKPVFFVACLDSVEEILDYRVHIAGRELCRDLSASPSMLQGRCIYIRKDVIRGIIWDRLQNLRGRKYPGALAEMFLPFGISRDDGDDHTLFDKIEAMLPVVTRFFVLHEIGEAFEDEKTAAWLEMIGSTDDKSVELYARAVKDLLADMSDQGTLGRIISEKDDLLLRISVALQDGLRREIFPEITNAYQRFMGDHDWSSLEAARRRGYDHAQTLRDRILALWEGQGKSEGMLAAIRQYLKEGAAQ